MAVKLDIITNVKGQSQVNKLQSDLNKLGNNAFIASKRIKQLEAAAAKSRATFASLGTTLKVGVAAGLAAVTFGVGKFIRDTFQAGNQIESLQIRFKLLFKSAQEGSKAFDALASFAAKVPFSLEEIAAGSGNLAVIAKDAGELSKILEITGNVAAATGLDFQQTATQIQRAFAGGIAAADVFRERGVRAMLGFEAGAKVSIEETRKRFFEVFGKGGQFGQATGELANTLTGQVSMVQDKYFQFRKIVSEQLFGSLTSQIRLLNKEFSDNESAISDFAKRVGQSLSQAFRNIESAIRFVGRNIDALITAFKIFIGLKIGTFVAGIASQFILLSAQILTATKNMRTLNVVMKANIVGIIVTAIQLAITAFIAFNDQIMKVVDTIKDFFIVKMKEAQLAVLNFISKLKVFPKQSKEAAEAAKILKEELESIRIEANALVNAYTKLNRKQKELFSGTKTTPDAVRDPSSRPNFDMAKNAAIAQKKNAERLAALNERIYTMNRHFIRDAGKASAIATAKQNKELERTANAREAYAQESKILFAKQLDEINAVRKGFSRGIKNSMKEALDVTTNFEKLGSSVFDTLTDAIAKFVQTGKLNFRDLANEFIAQIIRMETRALAAKAIQSVTGGKSIFGSIGKIFGFSEGGVVPGGAPYTDRVPALLTPGEVVIPRNQSQGNMANVINNTFNISGNVDQRAIDQIKAVITSSPSEVGGANKNFTRNTAGLRNRR
jgi:lambda family phage tail tape measure protein